MLCQDNFWNESLSWDTEEPKFTQCFKDTLPLIPCGVLIVTAIPWIIWLHKNRLALRAKVKLKPTTCFWSLKSMTTLLLSLTFAMSLGINLSTRIKRDQDLQGSGILHYSVMFASAAFAIGLVVYEKARVAVSSLPLLIFWPLLLLAMLPSNLEEALQKDHDTDLVFLILNLPSILALFVVNWFSDLSSYDLAEVGLGGLGSKVSPTKLSSHMSQLTITWLEPIIWAGYRKPLVQKDLPPTQDNLNVKDNVDVFMKHWEDHVQELNVDFASTEKSKKEVKLWKPLFKSFGPLLFARSLVGVVHYTGTMLSPLVLGLLIDHVDPSNQEEDWKGYLYAILLLAASTFNTLSFQHYVLGHVQVASQVRSSLISAILRKTLKLSNAARQKFTTGEITNYVSVDTQRLLDNVSYLGVLWGAPYQVILAMLFLYQELGLAAMAGLVGLALLMPANVVGSKMGEKIQERQLKAKDDRIKLMNEILAGMKVLKLYAWEIPFMGRINDIRNKEVKELRSSAVLWSFINFTFSMSPFLITIGSFSTYVWMDPELNILTPQKVFVSISLFNLMRIPLTLFPIVLKETIKMNVSIRRITAFLNAEELAPSPSIEHYHTVNDKLAVEVSNATFTWDDPEKPTLKNINLKVPRGSLTAIVGIVGSGKSSTISSMLGEMRKLQGSINVNGTIGYVPQQAWIQNMSLRDNILFGQPMVVDRYGKVLKACALEADLKVLGNGDGTEIGENGINLSGGQKQRVSFARAVYADQDIYLLDDPLSAVDAHVGKHIFEKVISSSTGLLQDKTRIWVTNHVANLPEVDHIVVMKNGEIIEQGPYQDLISAKSTFYEFFQQHLIAEEDNDDNVKAEDYEELKKQYKRQESEHPALANKEGDYDGRLVEDETSLTGHVPLHVFKDFLGKVGTWVSIFFFVATAAEQAIHAGGIVWLSAWSDEGHSNSTSANDESAYKLGIYATLGICEAIVQVIRDFTFYFRCALASKLVHEVLLKQVLRSPMSFFDTNPMGRIVNRFSSDIDIMDGTIPFQMSDFLWCLMEVITTIALISYVTPTFLIAVLPIFLVFLVIQRFYIVASRQLKRLYSVSKSPIFSHFSETVTGATSIRAYKVSKRFIEESEARVQTNVISYYLSASSNRWLSTRVETVGNVVIFLSALFAVLSKDTLSPGLAALSITYAMNITGSVVWMVRMACELENNCVALERIFEYTQNESEAPWELDEEKNSSKKSKEWLQEGKIEFQDYQTRYREGLDLVLRGVDMEVHPGEKIGICGRTGAGKSSLTLALFRIIEPAGGSIVIDGQDISKLGLHDLRSRLTIIPQDPVLFSGSLRFNLDPLGDHNDNALWSTLESAHLKSHIEKNVTGGLDHEVSEGGSNFSVGQRQLICLARAILRKTKILILDEATAAVDLETDELIQATLREQFSKCTVLTIAHRLNTILDSDKVAVFSHGRLVEMDKPSTLLKIHSSYFKSMANDAGIFDIK